MLYYNIKQDDKGNLYFEIEKEPKRTEFVIYDSSNGKVYPNGFMDVILEDEDSKTGLIGLTTVNLSDLRPITSAQAAVNVSAQTHNTIIKETKSRIKKPRESHYLPFTKAVVNAILKKGEDVALTQEAHTKKMGLISQINKIGEEGVKDISLHKASDLLKLFTLKIEDLFKEEYLKDDD